MPSMLSKVGFDHGLFRMIERTLKFSIFVCDAIMTLHCAMLLTGYSVCVAEYIAGFSLFGYVVLMMSSYLLRFCWRYRACLTHDWLVYTCIIYQREFGFGESLTFFRILMTAVGVALLMSILYSHITNVVYSKNPRPAAC